MRGSDDEDWKLLASSGVPVDDSKVLIVDVDVFCDDDRTPVLPELTTKELTSLVTKGKLVKSWSARVNPKRVLATHQVPAVARSP